MVQRSKARVVIRLWVQSGDVMGLPHLYRECRFFRADIVQHRKEDCHMEEVERGEDALTQNAVGIGSGLGPG